jgi:hypothetical protein
MHHNAEWQWTIVDDPGEPPGVRLELERVGNEGEEWIADGPGGIGAGTLREALSSAAGQDASREWLGAVAAAIERQIAYGDHGSLLLVARGEGIWYHATASRNRRSIHQHGLNWAHMMPPGIAGGRQAETAGIFLCSDIEGAEWFARMCRDGTADIWAATVHDVWLESAPAGNGTDSWMICPQTIPPTQLRLIQRDIPGRVW